MPDGSGWPEQTRRWWRMWRDDPSTATYHATDWADLTDTAVLHSLLWRGETKVAGELRLRVVKHGSTPLDKSALASPGAALRRSDLLPLPERFFGLIMFSHLVSRCAPLARIVNVF
jgi:hypothetical protein